MIASDDVRRVTFDRAMRGYRCEDVDDYLRQVADGIDSLAAENDDLQKKLVILAQRIDQYRADEDTLSTTMINAQRLGENVIKEAKQKAAEIIRAANIKAEDREQRARDEVELAQQELVTIKQEADAFKKRLMDLESQTRAQLPQPEGVEQRLEADSPGAASLARYLRGRGGGFPVYGNTAVTYFNGGEAKFAELLRQLETAEHYIFLEYFIIDEGLMWGRILEVLARKAASGVDVRVMYDGTCEFSTLPRDYPKRLEALGIRCKVFAPVTPFVSTHYNYRDHRKILVIDGRVGFTGGVNLADEYINHVEKYGRWKDAAVMLEGEGVRSMTALFLQMWSVLQEPEFEQFLRPEVPAARAEGFVVPYGDCPLDGERVGEMVYIDLLNRARKYVHIITPYLILDGELETALRFAAERGVDVHLILPGVPDKQFAYALAKTHYKALLSSGVKISEWTPGFTHAKLVVMDGVEAVVGTINLDYRSLYHHFENAVWMRRVGSIRDMETDFQDTLARCRTVEATLQSVWQGKKLLRLMGLLLKVIAPLM